MNLRERYNEETGKSSVEDLTVPQYLVYTDEYVKWLERELQEMKDIEDLP